MEEREVDEEEERRGGDTESNDGGGEPSATSSCTSTTSSPGRLVLCEVTDLCCKEAVGRGGSRVRGTCSCSCSYLQQGAEGDASESLPPPRPPRLLCWCC